MDELTAVMAANMQIFYRDGREISRWFYNDNGTIKKEGKKITGIVRMYHPGGLLASEMAYKNGELNGRYLLLSGEGRIEEEGSFKNNELHGMWKQFTEMATVKIEGMFKNGKRNGVFKLFYSAGMMQEEETYVNGQLEGFVRDYFETGRLETEAFYRKGKLLVLREFDPSGVLKKEEKY